MATAELINWLNDAYTMELGLAPILDNHARDVATDSSARARLQRHAAETRRHAALLQHCIERLGGRVSSVHATAGGVDNVATAPFRDELVKNALLDYASEHFEIACYRALIIAAREAGRDDVRKTCEQILAEEVAMASWLENQIPTVVLGAMRGREASA